MPKIIVFKQKGNFKKTRKFLKRCSNLQLDDLLDQYGKEGVEALAACMRDYEAGLRK